MFRIAAAVAILGQAGCTVIEKPALVRRETENSAHPTLKVNSLEQISSSAGEKRSQSKIEKVESLDLPAEESLAAQKWAERVADARKVLETDRALKRAQAEVERKMEEGESSKKAEEKALYDDKDKKEDGDKSQLPPGMPEGVIAPPAKIKIASSPEYLQEKSDQAEFQQWKKDKAEREAEEKSRAEKASAEDVVKQMQKKKEEEEEASMAVR